jgi:uncharacterized protein (DUF1778 family)
MRHIKKIRIGLRATIQQKSIIHKAAEIRQQSITEFILQSAFHAAKEILLDQRVFFTDDKDWKNFSAALKQPPKLKPALEKLSKQKAPWEE